MLEPRLRAVGLEHHEPSHFGFHGSRLSVILLDCSGLVAGRRPTAAGPRCCARLSMIMFAYTRPRPTAGSERRPFFPNEATRRWPADERSRATIPPVGSLDVVVESELAQLRRELERLRAENV